MSNKKVSTIMTRKTLAAQCGITLSALVILASPTAFANAAESTPSCTTSVNGEKIKPLSDTEKWSVNGVNFWTQKGEATWLLRDFVQWFDANIEPINNTGTKADDWSWAPAEELRKGSGACSNHGSGTAIDLNATKHPFKHRGTFTPLQTARIKLKIATYGGKLQWGGNWTDPADEMHVEYTPRDSILPRVFY